MENKLNGILRSYKANGKENGNPRSLKGIYRVILRLFWGYRGVMENKMETTIVYWGNIGTMENKMETTTVYCPYQD